MMNRKLISVILSFSLGVVISSMNACSQFIATDNISTGVDGGAITNPSASLFEKTQSTLARDCNGCHRAGGTAASFEFTTPQQFITAGLIVPGRPRQSKLIYRMRNFNDTTVTTDNMPVGGSAINSNDYQAIYDWIAEMPSDQNVFECVNDTFVPSQVRASHAKRISIRQYSNSLKDLLSMSITRPTVVSMVDGALNMFPLPSDTGQYFRRENNVFIGAHAQGFFDIADRLATTVSGSHLNDFVTRFIQLDPATCTSINVTTLSTACRTQLVRNFASRAFRRPLRDQAQNLSTTTGDQINEVADLVAEFNGVSTQEGVNRLIFRVLIAPHFSFQIEDQNLLVGSNLGSNTFAISPYAFISRLTLNFWNSIPDNTLWQMAETEDFTTNTGFNNVLNYVLGQRLKMDDAMREYYYDWLRLERTPNFNVSPRFALIAPNITFNQSLRSDMISEVEELASFLTTSGGTFEDLFMSDISVARSTQLMRVHNQGSAAPSYQTMTMANALRHPAGQRAGILTRPAMTISGSEFANPILRGAHLRKDILCLNLGAPPSDALDTFNGITVPNNITTREKVGIKTAGASCVGCHNLLNPLGFAFSNYNSLGMFITQEPVFRSGQDVIESYLNVNSAVDLSPLFGPGSTAQDAAGLSRFVAQQTSAKACFAEKFMSFSLNRPVDREDDACRLNRIYSNLNSTDPLLDMVRSTALDMEFRVRKLQ